MADLECKCAVCMELMLDPRVLPCGHPYCVNCILAIHIEAKETKDGKNPPTCPLCRKPFTLANDDPTSLEPSHYHLALLEQLQKQGMPQEPELDLESLNVCFKHDRSPLLFYDAQDLVNPFLCEKCAEETIKKDPSRNLVSFEEGAAEIMKKIEELLPQAEKRRDEIAEILKQIHENIDKVDKQSEQIESEIRARFKEFRDVVERMETRARSRLRDLHEEVMKPFEEGAAACKEIEEQIQQALAALQEAEQLEKESGDSSKVAAAREALKEATSRKIPELPPMPKVKVVIPEDLKITLDWKEEEADKWVVLE
eukprot:TRINITY_DN2073_c0_g1_i1.p1 TRINITY_DN2073_c0_g1~~TRINITY_DN2073_c0_g1_i1.p1  ORF type:complete len:312 (-),score=85.02 TRINITY_DN2073_c0_g1_i1:265-1200(-)